MGWNHQPNKFGHNYYGQILINYWWPDGHNDYVNDYNDWSWFHDDL